MTTLSRNIGRWELTGLVVNAVVGAAILGLPGRIFARIGNDSLLGWLPCAFAMGLVAACFAEVGSRFRHTGGPYLYAREALGPQAGFLVGWLSWVSRLFTLATIGNLMVVYAAGFVPALGAGWQRAATVTGLDLVLTACVLAGAHRSTRINSLLSIAKIALLGAFVVGGGLFALVTGNAGAPAIPPAPATTADWRAAFVLMTYAFLGVESAMINAGEMRDPVRDAPFALAVGFAIIAAIYIGVQAVCMAALPDLASSQRPVTEAVVRMLGPAGGVLAAISGLVVMFGTLFAVLLTGSRLPYGLAEHGQFPRVFAGVQPLTRTPEAAILLTAGLAWLLTLGNSFLSALTLTTLTRLVGYLTTCVALLILRRRAAEDETARFRLPAGRTLAVLAALTVLAMMAASTPAELIQVAALALAGLLVHLAVRRFEPRPAAELS